MIRQVVFVPLQDTASEDERTKALEAACNWDWLAEYRLVAASLFAKPPEPVGYYLFFEKD